MRGDLESINTPLAISVIINDAPVMKAPLTGSRAVADVALEPLMQQH